MKKQKFRVTQSGKQSEIKLSSSGTAETSSSSSGKDFVGFTSREIKEANLKMLGIEENRSGKEDGSQKKKLVIAEIPRETRAGTTSDPLHSATSSDKRIGHPQNQLRTGRKGKKVVRSSGYNLRNKRENGIEEENREIRKSGTETSSENEEESGVKRESRRKRRNESNSQSKNRMGAEGNKPIILPDYSDEMPSSGPDTPGKIRRRIEQLKEMRVPNAEYKYKSSDDNREEGELEMAESEEEFKTSVLQDADMEIHNNDSPMSEENSRKKKSSTSSIELDSVEVKKKRTKEEAGLRSPGKIQKEKKLENDESAESEVEKNGTEYEMSTEKELENDTVKGVYPNSSSNEEIVDIISENQIAKASGKITKKYRQIIRKRTAD